MKATTKQERANFGAAIKLVREKRGMTVEQLAELVDETPTAVELFEHGGLCATREGLEKTAEALGLPLNVLALIAADKSKLEGVERQIAEKVTDLALTLLERDDT